MVVVAAATDNCDEPLGAAARVGAKVTTITSLVADGLANVSPTRLRAPPTASTLAATPPGRQQDEHKWQPRRQPARSRPAFAHRLARGATPTRRITRFGLAHGLGAFGARCDHQRGRALGSGAAPLEPRRCSRRPV